MTKARAGAGRDRDAVVRQLGFNHATTSTAACLGLASITAYWAVLVDGGLAAHQIFRDSAADPVDRIRRAASNGVHRIAEVDFADHSDLQFSESPILGPRPSYQSLPRTENRW